MGKRKCESRGSIVSTNTDGKKIDEKLPISRKEVEKRKARGEGGRC